MEYVISIFVAVGLLVALWPWILMAAVVLLAGYVLWSALRRRDRPLD